MDHRGDVREFLVSRRARVGPVEVGLPGYGGGRRVRGSAEVVMLAGLSVDYYGRLERGNLARASESLLDGVARALRLDDAERPAEPLVPCFLYRPRRSPGRNEMHDA